MITRADCSSVPVQEKLRKAFWYISVTWGELAELGHAQLWLGFKSLLQDLAQWLQLKDSVPVSGLVHPAFPCRRDELGLESLGKPTSGG